MSHSWTLCKTCQEITYSETARYCEKHHPEIAIIGEGATTELSRYTRAEHVSTALGMEKLSPGEKIVIIAPGVEKVSDIFHMLTPEQQDMIVIVDESVDYATKAMRSNENSSRELIDGLLREANQRLVFDKERDPVYLNEDLKYGYRKSRQGTNKKYIKRKKAKNGRTQKRRK